MPSEINVISGRIMTAYSSMRFIAIGGHVSIQQTKCQYMPHNTLHPSRPLLTRGRSAFKVVFMERPRELMETEL